MSEARDAQYYFDAMMNEERDGVLKAVEAKSFDGLPHAVRSVLADTGLFVWRDEDMTLTPLPVAVELADMVRAWRTGDDHGR